MENKGCCAEKPADNTCSTGKTGGCGVKGKCCPGTIIKGAIVGGIVMFIYFYVSWMVLSWHKAPVALTNLTFRSGVYSFLFCLFSAALLTMLLKKRGEGCCPVAGSMIIGLLVGSFSYLPNVIWFHFQLHYSLAGLLDDVIAITLAGAAIGKIALKSGSCTMGKCGDKGKCEDKTGTCCNKTGSCN